jgi:branched-chain amino acid transport system ATP-binding protein
VSSSDSPTLLLDAHEVTVRFGGLTAVDAVSADFRAGELVGIIGPNGAGKTTFFNAISGVQSLTAAT